MSNMISYDLIVVSSQEAVATEESKMLRDDTAKHKNKMLTPARVSNTSDKRESVWSLLSVTLTVFHLVWGT